MLLPMEEPKVLDFDGVVETVNNTMAVWRYPRYEIRFKYQDGCLTVQDIPPTTTIQLPINVNKWFVFEDNAVFTNDKRLSLKPELIKEEEEEIVDEDTGGLAPALPTRGNFILVTTNISSSHYHDNKTFPTLRTFAADRYEQNGDSHIDFNPVLFLPLLSEEVSTLRVQFVDEFNRPVRFQDNSQLSVQLYFKTRY